MMKTRSATAFGPLSVGLCALLLGGAALGVTGASIAVASAREQSRAEKQALREAALAQTLLTAGKYAAAIAHAEAAVGFQPQVEPYRVLLGQSYLKDGRFISARDTFADALTLDAADGRAALHFALAQIATGDWAAARRTIEAHADAIGVADRGLAIALAGDPAAAVELLAPAARTPGSDAKLRQNLALSLALAGRWQEARTVVAIDVAPDQVDRRILEWAAFSRPKSASDQVAALLGVTPAVDPGLPVALALNTAVPTMPAVAAADPVDSYMPGKPAEASAMAQAAPVPVVEPAPVADAVATITPSKSGIVFGERHEVVQPIAAALANRATGRPLAVARAASARSRPGEAVVAPAPAAPHPLARGTFYIQLGAYQNVAVARDAWRRAGSRFAGFADRTPQGMHVKTAAGTLYRLSLGGFARADAVTMCLAYRTAGGACFVRAGAGDQIASWATGRELASR